MIQENVSVKEFPISFDLEPISNICASSLRKMQKKDTHKSFLSWPRAHLKNVHGKKKHHLKMVFGWCVQLLEKFDP